MKSKISALGAAGLVALSLGCSKPNMDGLVEEATVEFFKRSQSPAVAALVPYVLDGQYRLWQKDPNAYAIGPADGGNPVISEETLNMVFEQACDYAKVLGAQNPPYCGKER